MAAIKTMTIDQGSNYIEYITVTDTIGNPVDITNWVIDMMVRISYDSVVPIMTFSSIGSPINIFLNDPINGQFQLIIPNTVTTNISFSGDTQESVYDIEATKPTSEIIRLREGPFLLRREVTR